MPVIGTVGLLVLAERIGLLETVRPFLHELLAVGFHISRRLYNQVIQTLGE
ncbi:MAG: DUF3368 domain-containing protein [Chloroflexi bacterium]|nr:DUF3368 domain-containing protein [Chloroflexota bacterium]